MEISRGELDALLRQQLPRIRRVLYRYVGNDQELDDLTQKALVEIVKSIPGFRGESKLETWMHRLCVRVAWAHRERRRGVVNFVAIPEIADRTDAVQRFEDRELMRTIHLALERVPSERRMAFMMSDVEGFTAPEVAEALGVPEGTVYFWVREVRLLLRKVLKKRQLQRDASSEVDQSFSSLDSMDEP
jgi:RNA polymerase sigma-70 factor (ECF subfamily)